MIEQMDEHAFLSWLDAQPRDERYEYDETQRCPVALFLQSRGWPDPYVLPGEACETRGEAARMMDQVANGVEAWLPAMTWSERVEEALNPESDEVSSCPHTFGAAADRLRDRLENLSRCVAESGVFEAVRGSYD